jgi:hypothetical protein
VAVELVKLVVEDVEPVVGAAARRGRKWPVGSRDVLARKPRLQAFLSSQRGLGERERK